MSVFSLPTQRCFLIENSRIPKKDTFLCLRRGVSDALEIAAEAGCFSLPTQRCFWLQRSEMGIWQLFSAYAEVFLSPVSSSTGRFSFLCLRRGVSCIDVAVQACGCFSLPTQRCFSESGKTDGRRRLFSAYAEVFPRRQDNERNSSSFLCLRRGVSRHSCLHFVP